MKFFRFEIREFMSTIQQRQDFETELPNLRQNKLLQKSYKLQLQVAFKQSQVINYTSKVKEKVNRPADR